MKKHLRVFRTLFIKDFTDLFKNINVLIMVLLPLAFVAIYKFIPLGMPPAGVLMTGVLMNLCLTPLSVLGMVIAEEKEKNTMRTLMLSNVTGGEFITAKVAAVTLLTGMINAGAFFLAGFSVNQLPGFLLVTVAGSVCMLLLGALTGVVCRDQTSTGTLAGPLAMVFLLPPMLGQVGGVIGMVADWMPTTATIQLMFFAMGIGAGTFGAVAKYLGVLAVWTLAAAAAFALVFRKKGIDN